MRVWISAAAALACLASAIGAAAAPLEVYGKLPAIEDVAVSADGSKLAMIATDGEKRLIIVKTVADDQTIYFSEIGDTKLRDVAWAGPKHLLLTVARTGYVVGLSGGKDEWYLPFSVDLETGKLKALMNNAKGEALNTVVRVPSVRMIDGEPMVFLNGLTFPGSQGVLTLFRYDLAKSAPKTIRVGSENTRDFVLDANGEIIAESAYDSRQGRWSLKVRGSKGWQEAGRVTELIDAPSLVGLGRSPGSVLVTKTHDHGDTLHEVSLETGEWSEALDDIGDDMIVDPATHRLIGFREDQKDGTTAYRFFDPQDQRVWQAILKAYPGEQVAHVSWSADRKVIVARVDSPTEGPAFALVDLKTGKAKWIGAEYVGLGKGGISPKRHLTIKAGDGLELPAFLTTPNGREVKGLPLVVLAHGGPAGHDDAGFDWWSQALAARGYAVLQVNFRGSDGLGYAHMSAGFGQWGRKMQTDLSDGVRKLAADGVIDPERVCIVGWSYGGYAALAGATIDRGVYRCAVSGAGVADLRTMLLHERRESGRQAVRYWARFMGAEDPADPVLAGLSPARLADKADIPILLIHGKDDTVVPFNQSQQMADALAKAGKPAELITLKGEDHNLSRGDTRLAMLKATVDFLEKHNPPD